MVVDDCVHGIDLNRYRAGVPLKTAKQQGSRFLICKCSERLYWVDPTYETYQKEAKSLGLPFGGYIYWRFVFDAVGQAKHYVDNLGIVQFPPIVDVERYLNRRPGGQPIVSVQANRNHLKVVLEEIERLTGVRPMIYTNFATWREQFLDWDIITEYSVWVANWRLGHKPYMPKPATEWVLHQYTDNYQIEGYYRGVDGNWFNGNEGDFAKQLEIWREQWGYVSPPPPPVRIITHEVVELDGNTIYVLQPGESVVTKVEEV